MGPVSAPRRMPTCSARTAAMESRPDEWLPRSGRAGLSESHPEVHAVVRFTGRLLRLVLQRVLEADARSRGDAPQPLERALRNGYADHFEPAVRIAGEIDVGCGRRITELAPIDQQHARAPVP